MNLERGANFGPETDPAESIGAPGDLGLPSANGCDVEMHNPSVGSDALGEVLEVADNQMLDGVVAGGLGEEGEQNREATIQDLINQSEQAGVNSSSAAHTVSVLVELKQKGEL